jgi:hypothetical protein
MFTQWWKRSRGWRSTGSVAAVTVLLAGLAGAAGAITPAYADEPGLFCTTSSVATMSSSPRDVQYGLPVTVRWNLVLRDCVEPVFYIVGPGFGGDIATSGARQVPAVSDFNTITWSLYLYDIETDFRTPVQMASTTVVVH